MKRSPATTSQASEPSPRTHYDSFDAHQGFEDEIDLLALIKAVLATWKPWLLAVILVSVVFAGYQVSGYLSGLDNAPYTKVISLTFEGADRGEYPNGAPYRVRDIAAPAVLQSVYEDLSIGESGVSMSAFRNAITVEPYTPYYREIVAKYDAQLDPDNQDFDQIQALQDRKRSELNNALNSGALISYSPAELDLPEATIREAIVRIPLEWARHAIADKGVLKSDIQLVSGETLNASLFQNVDYVVLSDLFADKTRALRENIQKVAALPGSSTVQDPETGWTLSDLTSNLYDLETYQIDDLISPIRSLGLSRTPRLAVFYFEEKQEKLREELTRLEEESELIKAAYNRYSPDTEQTGSGNGAAGNGVAAHPGVVPQLGSEVLDKLLEVAGESSVEEYRQALNGRWLAANLRIAAVKSDLRSTARLIDAVKGNGSDASTEELREEYLRRAEARVPEIVSRLRDFYEVNSRIYHQISRESVGSVGYLYKDGHQGVLRAGPGLGLRRTILTYIALMAAVTFVVVPAAMVRNAMKQRRHEASTS